MDRLCVVHAYLCLLVCVRIFVEILNRAFLLYVFLLRMVIKYASVGDGLGCGNEGPGIVYLCTYLIVCVCEGGGENALYSLFYLFVCFCLFIYVCTPT